MVITYVADIDSLASLGSGSSVVGERVWWSRWTTCSGTTIKSTVVWWATESASKASTAASEAAAESTASAKARSTTTWEAAEATTSTAKASTWWEVVSEAVLANLKVTSLPIESIKLLDSVAGVVWRLESDNAGSLWSSVWADVNISTDHSTLAS